MIYRQSTCTRLALCATVLLFLVSGCAQQAVTTSTAPAPAATATPLPPSPTLAPTETPLPTLTPTPVPTDTPVPTPTPQPITLAPAQGLPADYVEMLKKLVETKGAVNGRPLRLAEAGTQAGVTLALAHAREVVAPLAQRFYAVVVPFDTVADEIALADLQGRWEGEGNGPIYAPQIVTQALSPILGNYGGAVLPETELLARLEAERGAIGVLPFDQLDPRFKVLAVEGSNILSNELDEAAYPLSVALVVDGPDAQALLPDLQQAIGPATNREADKLTTLVMTGVTAMTRMTALKMEQKGYTYPAEIIGETLKAADITHVSNEVPFIQGCEVNATPNNLTMCSDFTYWAALEAIGTDIVGLSGNHVNDFGRDGARESLGFYRERKIPIYGSGLNTQEACAPLMWEHNGNTFAFIAALAFDPEFAWATDSEPGACYYYQHKEEVLSSVRELGRKVDVVAVELQYYETYQPNPTEQQVAEFRELRAAGADIVTGVQSHVPQALEPYGASDPGGAGAIVYGLGNLFFDQMWSWETRTELYVRHTIYDGRLLSTEVLTGVLEDYAQPRWATPKEREEILNRIYGGAPARP